MNISTSVQNTRSRLGRSTAGHLRLSVRHWLVAGVLGLAVAGCGGTSGLVSQAPTARASTSTPPTIGSEAPSASPGSSESTPPSPSAAPGDSQAPDVAGGTTAGDVPDNAVFLTYHQASLGFSIQYVEGWQVTTQPDGVVIKDKDSSEAVAVVDLPSDVASYVTSTDLPSLQGQAGFKLVKHDTVKVGGATYQHLAYHILSPADPVTGKQVPSIVDRYYVPGPAHLAIVSLSTPDGVDNVDAFRRMIESLRWA
jgi:hypothetical protein